ncbi:MAG: aromatic ring-hydroxylating dioxygenase subunit alpha [Chitinophagaceae bacterium]|nr:aromatic ring-hydroxylating dioxygenase subunit alpha [Chitinophagaceae bacterium]
MNDASIRTLINGYRQGYSLEQPFYTSSEIFDFEWQHVWKKYWLFAGTTAEIPKPGDYFVYTLQNDSIIIIRGNDGEVFAHYNTCRHRGSLICLEEKGHAPKLVCPYHQWVFEKDGSLFKARLMPENFDKSAYHLHPVKITAVGGFIFISLSDYPPPINQLETDFSPFLKPFKIDDSKIAYRKKYTLRTNWKLIAENFRECYHCGPAHPEYCSAVIGANMKESADEVLAEKKVDWQNKGLATETVEFTDQSFHFAIRYPLRPGVESYSLDGRKVAMPMGDHTDYDAGVVGMVVYPNFWMDAVSDYMWTMRLTAISASCTLLDLCWLVDADATEGKDYNTEKLIEFWRITGEQDWKLCENNFKGIESSRYSPGPYAPAEYDVVKYIDWYINRLKEGIRSGRNSFE